MATHTKVLKWGEKSHTSLAASWSIILTFDDAYKQFPYQYTTKAKVDITWKTSLDGTPGDLEVYLATSTEEINNKNWIWKSSIHNSYGSWKTFSFEIPLDKFMQIVTTNAKLYLRFSATIVRKWYMDSASITITYTIPDITYTYKDWNGRILKKETLEKGTTPTPPPDPTKADDDKYSYTFAGWTIYDESTNNVTYVAEYDQHIHKYTITISTDGNGKITNKNGTEAISHKVNYGSVPELTAVPNDGYRFLKWQDGNTENPRKFPAVTSDITIMALFEPTGETEFYAYLGTSSNKITGRLGTTEAQGYIGTTRVF